MTVLSSALNTAEGLNIAIRLILDHLKEQGRPCLSGNSKCVGTYKRGDLRCAIGSIMTDEEIERIGDYGIGHGIAMDRLGYSFKEGNKEILDELRLIHDIGAYWKGIWHVISAIESRRVIKLRMLKVVEGFEQCSTQ